MRRRLRRIPRRAGTLAAILATLALGTAARPPLEPGPGLGFRTAEAPQMRALRPGVTLTPIITVGDSLIPANPDNEAFVFAPVPDGIGARIVDGSIGEIYVTHEISWRRGYGAARVSRLLVNRRSGGVLAADYLLDGTEGFTTLCAATLAWRPEGFLAPTFFVNEESLDGFNRGVVAAIDTRDGTTATLPWLGRFEHESTIFVPLTSGRTAAVLTEDGPPGQSQLYLYLADNDAALLSGDGRLHVLRANTPAGRPNTGFASMATSTRSLTGRFVALPKPPPGMTIDREPAWYESAAEAAGALDFVRLEDAAPDRERLNAFYVVDTGDDQPADPATGAPVTEKGRIYHVALDPTDPTRVESIEVILDADRGDDFYRPDNIESDERGLFIQEDPGARGLHPARLLRYEFKTRRLEPWAECAERDPRGRLLPSGTGGLWESTGIVDASALFGPDSWLVAVQAHSLESARFHGRQVESGQLLLMQGPGAKRRGRPVKQETEPAR